MVCKSVDPLYNQEWQKILHFTFGNPWSTVYCGEPADCRARPRPLIAPYSNMVPWICKNRTIWGPPVQPRVTENITALYFWHPLEHCALWRTSRLQSQTKTINCTMFKTLIRSWPWEKARVEFVHLKLVGFAYSQHIQFRFSKKTTQIWWWYMLVLT